ncbi:hypothetical protein BDW59DRAFT_160342 [Aspergillus cavernicola]|uniref:Uncharacterized protein n=1 Tax=Aspergillus cavernicola TaxID=176166 RepID=A0ABR4IHX9_9EURO
MGSLNWAVFVSFEDGVRWVFRSPGIEYPSMPIEITLKLLASEVATLRYVKAYSSIPVPEVYDYCDTPDNEIKAALTNPTYLNTSRLHESDNRVDYTIAAGALRSIVQKIDLHQSR